MTKIIKISLSVLFFAASAGASAQKLELSASEVRFGTISKPEVRTVALYNRTPKAAVVVSADVDCNCTKVDYSPRPIKSGDSTLLTIRYTPTASERGAFYKVVTIKNSAGDPLKLVVRGTVK